MTISGRPEWGPLTDSDFFRAVPSPRKRLLTRRCGAVAASWSRRDHGKDDRGWRRRGMRPRPGVRLVGLLAPQTPHFAARNIIQKKVQTPPEGGQSQRWLVAGGRLPIRLIFGCPSSLGAGGGRGPHAAMKWNDVEETDLQPGEGGEVRGSQFCVAQKMK